MNIRRATLRGFTVHDATAFVLPRTGVVVVTGDNGGGKSSLIEAVAWGAWGRTLRGSPPWRGDDSLCSVALSTDTLTISRVRSKGKNSLAFNASGNAPTAFGADEYTTATKAQEALGQLTPAFDVWRRSSVFSSADAAHFTLATDAERKRLIETVLGLDRFGPALDACRVALKAAAAAATAERAVLARAAQAVEASRLRAREAKGALATGEPPPAPEPVSGRKATDYDAQIAACAGELRVAREHLRKLDGAGAEHAATARQTQAVLDRLRGSSCPTCGQAIPAALRDGLQAGADDAHAKCAEARATAELGRDGQADAIEELEEEQQALQAHRAAALAAARVAQAADAEAARYTATRTRLTKTMHDAEQEMHEQQEVAVTAQAALDTAEAEEAVLTITEQVLGLRGVRAHLLGRALTGIEQVANSWLARLRQAELQLKLSPYSEKKSGGVADSISLEVLGAGGGHGYRAASGGERRRIDVALLLALAEVASGASGSPPGTMFYDEVFDCLDDAGIEAICGALKELSQARAVVVVTHSEALVARLPFAQRLHVAQGVLGELG